jgi:hypothetical protein
LAARNASISLLQLPNRNVEDRIPAREETGAEEFCCPFTIAGKHRKIAISKEIELHRMAWNLRPQRKEA